MILGEFGLRQSTASFRRDFCSAFAYVQYLVPPPPLPPHPLRIIFGIMGLGKLPAKVFIANDLLSKYSGIRT
jgi:hypothetical protein